MSCSVSCRALKLCTALILPGGSAQQGGAHALAGLQLKRIRMLLQNAAHLAQGMSQRVKRRDQ